MSRRIPRRGRPEDAMGWVLLLSGAMAAGLFVYLFWALLRPERF